MRRTLTSVGNVIRILVKMFVVPKLFSLDSTFFSHTLFAPFASSSATLNSVTALIVAVGRVYWMDFSTTSLSAPDDKSA